MKVKEFMDLVNNADCEEFSDIPEKDVELVASRVNETWNIEDTYSTSMNVYKCEDGYVGVTGLCHCDMWYYELRPELLSELPHCVATEVIEIPTTMFVPKSWGTFIRRFVNEDYHF